MLHFTVELSFRGLKWILPTGHAREELEGSGKSELIPPCVSQLLGLMSYS